MVHVVGYCVSYLLGILRAFGFLVELGQSLVSLALLAECLDQLLVLLLQRLLLDMHSCTMSVAGACFEDMAHLTL
jgi:hypothetical protein